jgi:hypothetical protein
LNIDFAVITNSALKNVTQKLMTIITIKVRQEVGDVRTIAAEKEAQIDDLEDHKESSHHPHHNHEGEFHFVVGADCKNQVN